VVPGPDPLGKRALFWMTVGPEAEIGVETTRTSREAVAPPHHSVRRARSVGKHALFSEATPASEEEKAGWAALAVDPVPPRGLFVVSCSSCGSVSRIGLLELLWCQLPVPAWLPRRTFDRWMTCPSCRRRTWASVTLAR
jgi:hypothetical protein